MINRKKDLFDAIELDKNSPVPIYFQLQQGIHELINNKQLSEGEQLPTEEEVCSLFNISRMTVRQAYNSLLKMELIYRQKGRGTFVASQKYIFELSRLHSFSEDMKKRGFKIRSQVLEKNVIKADKDSCEKLKVNENAKLLKIKRVRFVQDVPVAVETSIIPLKQCPNLINEDLSKESLFLLMEKKYKLIISHSHQSLEPILASREDSSLLRVKVGSPLIRMTGITFLKNNMPIEYITGIYRGDRYQFNLNLKR